MCSFTSVLITSLALSSLLSCKPRRADSGLRNAGAKRLCPSPDPASYLVNRYPGDLPNLQLAGDIDLESSKLAQDLVSKESNPPDIQKNEFIVIQLNNYMKPADRKWLLVAADTSLFIYQWTANVFKLKYRIDDLMVKKVYVGDTSEAIAFIAGKNGEELNVLRVNDLAFDGNAGGDTKARAKFLAVRDAEVKKLGEQHTLTFTLGLASKPLEAVVSDARPFGLGVSTVKDIPFYWKDFWFASLLGVELPHWSFNQNDDFRSNKLTSIALLKAPGANLAEQYYAGRTSCQPSQSGKVKGCEIAISYHTKKMQGPASETFLFRRKITESTGNPEIKLLTVGRAPDKRLAYADYNGIHVLTYDVGHNYRIKKSFLTQIKISELMFVNTFENDSSREYLVYGFETGDEGRVHQVIDLNTAFGPLTLGKHGQSPNPYDQDWRFKDFRKTFPTYKKLDRVERAAYWDKLLTDDSRAIYAAEFAADCQSVITGGSDGQIKIWDIRSLQSVTPTQEAPSRILGGGVAHARRVTALTLGKKNPTTLLSVGEDGLAKLWSTAIGATETIDQFPKAPLKPAEDGSISAPLKLGKILAASFTPNEDAIAVAPENDVIRIFNITGDDIYPGLNTRALEESFSKSDSVRSFVSLAPFPGAESTIGSLLLKLYPDDPDAKSIQNSLVYATRGGALLSSDVREGGHLQIYMKGSVNAQPYLDLALTAYGQWILASRPDGLVQRYYNNSIDRYSSSVPDVRCTGSEEMQKLYKKNLEQKPIVEGEVGFRYKKHKGPVLGVSPIVLTYDDLTPFDERNGVVSVGIDGSLIVWNLLDSCTANDEKDTGSWYDNKLRNVYYSNSALTSLATSIDSNFAVTGTLDGQVLLWWIGDEMNLDQ